WALGTRLKAETTVVVLGLTEIGQNVSSEQCYSGLRSLLGQQVQLEDELKSFWSAHADVGPCERFFQAVRRVVLPTLCQRRPSSETSNLSAMQSDSHR